MSPPIPTTDWPKSYLLECHAKAVEHGMIFVEPISQADADSFTKRFYRIRRRADKSMAAFIPPEYQLVTVGEWQPFIVDDLVQDVGRLPIIYSKLPSGAALPVIRPATPDELGAVTAPIAPVVETPPIPLETLIDEAALERPMDAEEINSFVAGLARKVDK